MTTAAEFRQELLQDKAELRGLIAQLEELGDAVDADTMALLRRCIARHCKNEDDFLAFVEGLG